MKYVIVFGAVCVAAGLMGTFWLWCYAERNISLRASPASLPEGNGITQPLLAEENGSSRAPQPQQDIHQADAVEAQQDEVVSHSVPVTPAAVDAGAVASSRVDEQQEEQRNKSNSSSSSRKSTPESKGTPVGETTLEGDKGQESSLESLDAIQQPEESETTPAAQEEHKPQESNSRSNSSSSPVASAGDDGDNEDPPAGTQGNGGGAIEENGERTEVLPSSGDSATAR